MPFNFKLPDLGEGIHEAEILGVKISSGQMITEDAPLFEVETDKAVVEIPSPVAGKIADIYVKTGDMVAVGTVMVSIEDSSMKADQLNNESKIEAVHKEISAAVAPKQNEASTSRTEVIATPATRQLARELKIDIHLIKGTGSGGKVSKEDVLAFAAAKNKTAELNSSTLPLSQVSAEIRHTYILPDFQKFGSIERIPLRSIRRKTAQQMSLSWSKIPHVTHCDEANITELMQFKNQLESPSAGKGSKLTITAFLIKAIVAALQKFPEFNASLDEEKEEIIFKRYYNIGVAVATERGLIVPTIKSAGTKTVFELAAEVQEIAGRARSGKIDVNDLQGSSFTLTNIGAIGGTSATPIINYPESAILAALQAKEKPIVRNNKIEIGLILPLSLAFDHRLADGAEAARFVQCIIKLLENPSTLVQR